VTLKEGCGAKYSATAVRISFKPQHVPLQSGTFSGITESKDEYVHHDVHARQKPKVWRINRFDL
jgi:hypothetical protein